MSDVIFPVMALAFFLASLGLVFLCQRLMRP